MSVQICHARIDERGRISGGRAGDQSGREVSITPWYSKPWKLVIRHPNEELGRAAATLAVKAANSNLIGYDQGERNSFYRELKKHNFNLDAYIASGVRTETDCSAFMYAIWCCLLPQMRADGNAPTTSTMRGFFAQYGFTVLTGDRYLISDRFLKTGDVLVKPAGHTAIAINDGSDADSAPQRQSNTSVRYRVTASALNVRRGAGTAYPIVAVVHKNEVFNIVEIQGHWGRLESGTGWISLNYAQKV